MVKAQTFPVAKFKPAKFKIPVFATVNFDIFGSDSGSDCKPCKPRIKKSRSGRQTFKSRRGSGDKGFLSRTPKFRGKKALVFASKGVSFASEKFKERRERKALERIQREERIQEEGEKKFEQQQALRANVPIDRSKSSITEFDEEGNEIKK